jgi:aminoglycoside phosphotransferase (APT) family kinase protein
MTEPVDHLLDHLRAAIVRIFPDLEGASFRLLTAGWDATAVDVDGRLVFKFPKDHEAETALLREASVLAEVRPRISMPVPQLSIHDGPPIFSRHDKIPGEHLLPDGYQRLSEGARDRLGEALGRFYAELHQFDPERMMMAGATPIPAWQSPQNVRAAALPRLEPRLRDFAETIVSEFEKLGPDPNGSI